MRKIIFLFLTGLLLSSCSSDTVDGNPYYLTGNMLRVEIEQDVWMFFLDNGDGTASVTYDRSNPMHLNINEGSVNDYYKGVVTVPSTITVNEKTYEVVGITESAFMNCSKLTKIVIPASVKTIGTMAFYNCQALEEVIVQGGLEEIPDYCFGGCRSLKLLSVAGEVNRLGVEAFVRCSALEQLQMPKGVTVIDVRCFNSCTSLNEIAIPQSVTVLQDSVFYNCSKMLTAFLPETLKSIGTGTFAGCRSIIEVTIPASVESIGEGSFCSVNSDGVSNWKNLTLNIKATVPPKVTGSISNATSRKRIVVPVGCREAYMAAEYWNEFTQIMERNY